MRKSQQGIKKHIEGCSSIKIYTLKFYVTNEDSYENLPCGKYGYSVQIDNIKSFYILFESATNEE